MGVCVTRRERCANPSPRQGRSLSEQRRVPAAIRTVAFPAARRGYERRAVDAYVTRINRLIAELEATRSPKDAVEHALERTQDERSAMLRQARETAAEIMETAQGEAEEITAAARADAANIVVDASTQADSSKAQADDYVAKARAEAEHIVAQARGEATEQLQRAQEEIAELREEAQAWLQELRIDTERIWNERRDLVDDLREIAARLQEAVSKTGPTHRP
jgi:cell division septum initiation protein DivIVA